MLKNSLFTIIKTTRQENIIFVSIQINPDHEIFKGHFPGQPVLPGACMLQILKEVLEDTHQISFRLKKADNMKFLAMIDPIINYLLDLKINYTVSDENLHVIASLSTAAGICFKFKGLFAKV